MIKILSQSIKEFKKNAILSPTFVALEVVLDVLIPLAMALVIDEGVKKGNINYIYLMGGLMFLMSVLSLVFGIASGNNAAKASAGFCRNLRSDMYKNIQTFSFSNIDNFSSSSLITRMSIDISYVQFAFQMIIRIMVRAPFMLIFAFIACLLIEARLALIFAFAVPFLGLALFLLISKAMPNFKKLFKKYDDFNLVIQENLRGIRTVKSFVKEDEQIEKFKKESAELKNYSLRAERLITWNGPVLQFTVYTCIILISLIGSQFVISETLKTGQMLSFFTYVYQILMNLMNITMVLVMVAIARPSASRIVEVLKEESDLKNVSDPIYCVNSGKIVFDDVSFGYKSNKMVLKNLNFKIESGMVVGIIGGTGSAKSTLVNLISRLYDCSSGNIYIDDILIKNYDLKTLRDNVSVVLQKNVLFSGTIKDNLKWGNKDATDDEINQALKLACCEFISELNQGIDTVIDQGGTNVSGGQRQRLCIARALLKKPKILILDDSTSAVDTKTDALIRQTFKEKIPEVTKIIVAQRISSVDDADMIIVLDNGMINGIGTHQELLETNKIYKEVYESQIKGVGEPNEAA